MLSANNVQKAREGKGFYTPEEFLVWDLSAKSDLYNDWTGYNPSPSTDSYETGAYNHQFVRSSDFETYHTEVSIVDQPREHVVNEYAVCTSDYFEGTKTYEYTWGFAFALNLKGNYLIDNDISRMDIFIKLENANFDQTTLKIIGLDSEIEVSLGSIELDTLNSVKISVEDLVIMDSFNTDEKILIMFSADDPNRIELNSLVIFDMQLYGLRGKTNSIAILSLWNVVHSITMILMGLTMLPQFSFGGLAKRLTLSKGSN
ncbi:MAG: hypothetical protein ACTSQL_07395 [Promethearchaeota archaeon]